MWISRASPPSVRVLTTTPPTQIAAWNYSGFVVFLLTFHLLLDPVYVPREDRAVFAFQLTSLQQLQTLQLHLAIIQ